MPPLLDPRTIPVFGLPPEAAGLRILHLTDFHIRAGKRSCPPPILLQRLADEIKGLDRPIDLLCITGDLADRQGDERAAVERLAPLLNAILPRVRHGAFGIFGNHDPARLPPLAAHPTDGLPGVRWLHNESHLHPDLPLRLVGTSEPEDILAATAGHDLRDGRFNLALIHYPPLVHPAERLGVHLALAGHTHGGQWRLSPRLAMHTSSDLPPAMPSGLLALRRTRLAIARGLGASFINLRILCPPHAPLYTLRPAGPADPAPDRLTPLIPW